jgi:zinc protease
MKLLWCIALLLISYSTASFAAPVQQLKSKSGLTIWLMEDHSLPLIAANFVFTKAGTAYDSTGKEGRTNLAASLLLEGAGKRDAKAFNQTMEEYAIRLNVGTDDDTLGASLQTLSDNRDLAFSMMADALIHPRFDADAITRARGKILTILKEASESPRYKLQRGWQKALYANHAYARDGLGTAETIAALTSADLKEYTRHYLTQDNVIISVVGDIDAATTIAMFDQYFAALPTKYDADTTLADYAVPSKGTETSIAHDIPQTLVKFGFAGLKREDPRYLSAYVLNHIIGGSGLGSLLAEEIRIKRGLAYSVGTQLAPNDFAAEWAGMFSTQTEKTDAAIKTLKDTLANIHQQGITQKQLDDAKSYLTGSFVLNLDSNADIANFLSIMQRYHLGVDYLEKRNSLIEKITLNDINPLVSEFLNPAHLHIITLGKRKE